MDISEKAKLIIESNIDTTQKAVELTTLIQNIPYARIGSLDPADMLKAGKGSCTPKHIYLARLLKKIGVPTKFLFMPFFYSKQKFTYPDDGKEVLKNMPISYHVALKVFINDGWKTVDVTWDPQLKGFPHSEWDGNIDMELGVTPESIEEVDQDPSEFEKQKITMFTAEEQEARKNFYGYFDALLEKSRQL